MTGRHSLDQIERGYLCSPDAMREIAAYVRDLEERIAELEAKGAKNG